MKTEKQEPLEVNQLTTSGHSNSNSTLLPNLNPESKPNEVVKNLENVTYIYRQDIVKRNIDDKVGMVTDVAGDSSSDSSITDNEDMDDEEDGGDEGGGNNGDDKANGSERDEDSYESAPLPSDQVRVLWMDESETTENLSDVTVIDRGFLHGDYVASALDPTGQVGVVTDVNISVDLLTPNGSIIKDVSSKDLKRVTDYTVGDYVVMGPWLGRVDDVLHNVTVMFDDGSMCKVAKADPLRLTPSVGRSLMEDGHFPYYPGQHVKASSSSVFKNARWLSGLWKPNRLEATVTKVTIGSVFIYWIASAGYGPDSSTAPAEEQSPPKNLTLLSCLSYANWQLGDWCLAPSSALSSSIFLDKGLSDLEICDSSSQRSSKCDSQDVPSEESKELGENINLNLETPLGGSSGSVDIDAVNESGSCSGTLSTSKEPVRETCPLHRKKIRKVVVRRDKKARKKEETFEKALMIVNVNSKVDVAWQDGTMGRGLDSITLIPVDTPGDHEFLPEQYVVEKAADENNDSCDVGRVGVVKSVDAKERTACVRWLKPVARAEDPREFEMEEMVSVYELEGHQDYDYCHGDVVVRLLPANLNCHVSDLGSSVEQANPLASLNVFKQDSGKELGSKKVDAESIDETLTYFSNLSWVGTITGLRNGDIEVTWADGMVSTVGPQAIYVVGRDDDESVAVGSEVSDGAATWETVDDDNEMDILEHGDEENMLQNGTSISPKSEESMIEDNFGSNGALSIPLAALGFMSRLASGIFSRGRKELDPIGVDLTTENELQSQLMEDFTTKSGSGEESSLKTVYEKVNFGLETSQGKGDKHANISTPLLDVPEAVCALKPEAEGAALQHESFNACFKGFDVAKDPSDHHFLGCIRQSNAGRKWLKKVNQDWNILQNNLPDTICVRVYEDRMDLLRAVIVGAYGTPYQDGLFFFDFYLPPEYPDSPPSAYYHSGGWRINPNLYEEGKVCLSLLNTWSGKGNEVWDPSSSSILQVLVSLQGLVLNSKPYFNEAGYDKQVGTAEGEKNSLSYNENTYLLNCKTMMYLMRKPPKDFEMLIREHFRRRGYYVLKACDAYMKGYLIGTLTKDASVSDKSNANANSVGFKLMLAKIVPKLFSALSEIGADCDEFRHLLQWS